jgi:16S rRNA (guanine527-N7)-methyltransferase
MRTEFINAINAHQSAFGLSLSEGSIEHLANYYDLIMEHNPVLHLVGPCSPEEFATRHILESLTLLEHLPKSARFADIGTGAGLPSIPCVLVREDLRATLIESKEKKTDFLRIAIDRLGLGERASVVNKQFSETDAGDSKFVACRALDKFSEKLPSLIKWSGRRSLLLFGGENLRDRLQAAGVGFVQKLMPLSERRFLFIAAER